MYDERAAYGDETMLPPMSPECPFDKTCPLETKPEETNDERAAIGAETMLPPTTGAAATSPLV